MSSLRSQLSSCLRLRSGRDSPNYPCQTSLPQYRTRFRRKTLPGWGVNSCSLRTISGNRELSGQGRGTPLCGWGRTSSAGSLYRGTFLRKRRTSLRKIRTILTRLSGRFWMIFRRRLMSGFHRHRLSGGRPYPQRFPQLLRLAHGIHMTGMSTLLTLINVTTAVSRLAVSLPTRS